MVETRGEMFQRSKFTLNMPKELSSEARNTVYHYLNKLVRISPAGAHRAFRLDHGLNYRALIEISHLQHTFSAAGAHENIDELMVELYYGVKEQLQSWKKDRFNELPA